MAVKKVKKKRNGISTSARKAKGRKLQQIVRDLILESFKEQLDPDDVRSTSMGASGEDVLLSPMARKLFPFSIECKNVESLNIYKAIEQCEANAKGHTPTVVFKRNGMEPFIAIPLKVFMEIYKKSLEK